MSGLHLRGYQSDLIRDLGRAYALGHRAPLAVLPTGGGKTVCFTYMAKGAHGKGRKVLLLAHRRELVGQISMALERWDVPHGLITPAHPSTTHAVQVAMVQTLAKRIRLDRSGRHRYDFVIVDEAHHAVPGGTWGSIMHHNRCGDPNGARLLGVSATPCRLDGKGLGVSQGGYFDAIAVGPTVEDLIAQGCLAPPVVYAPDRHIDLSGVKQRGGDYQANQLAAAVRESKITGDAVEHYRRICSGAPSIAFTVDIAESARTADEFKKAGYQAAVLSGATPDRERAAMIRDLGAGKLHVLASCNVVSEGTDIPAVAAAILLRPTASYALAMQQMGRALRALPGKERAILLDHAGNSLRHGLPTDPVEWSLEGVRRKKQAAPSKPCFTCGAMVPARATECPGCGREFATSTAVDAPEMESERLPFEAGELIELTPEKREELRRWRNARMREARSLEDFQKIGQVLGYKPGWAWHRMQEMPQSAHG